MASGSYRASLAREAASQRLVVERLTAGFDLHVFSRARVRLPFHRDEVTLLPEQSLLDGRVIRPEWEADGRALVVEVAAGAIPPGIGDAADGRSGWRRVGL